MERRKHVSVTYCLGQYPHAMPDKAVVCPICSCLREQVTIGHYEVLQRIGKGRSGDAYVVMHLPSRQVAVLKLFPPNTGSRPLWDAAVQEIRKVTALGHPAILPVFQCTLWNPDIQSPSSSPSLGEPSHIGATATQEYLLTFCHFASFSLTQIVEGRSQAVFQAPHTPEPLAWIVDLLAAIGDILSLAHSRGIIHGALVPGNILYAPPEHFWLADFGLAGLHPPFPPYLAPEIENAIRHVHSDQKLVLAWHAKSPASDQYSLAITYKQLFDMVLPQSINDSATPILRKAMHPDPLSRFESIAQLTQALIEQLTAKKASSPAKQQEPAISVAQDLHSLYPTQENDWEEQGNNAFRTRNYELAVQAYQQATTINPLNAGLWAALGDSLFAIDQNKDAVDAYNKALRLNPMQADIWMNRGTALEQLGRTQEALACYEHASRLRDQY